MLAEKLKETKESRVINVASGAHQFVKDMNFEDLQSKNEFKPMQGLWTIEACKYPLYEVTG